MRRKPPKSTRNHAAVASVVDLVRDWMDTEGLSPGDRVPSERDLAARLGVGRGQVRSAYAILEGRGELVATSPRIRMIARPDAAGAASLSETLTVISTVSAPKPGVVSGHQEQLHLTAVASATHAAGLSMLTVSPEHIGAAALRRIVDARPLGVVALGGVLGHDGGVLFLDRLRAAGLPVTVLGDELSEDTLAMTGFDYVRSDHERGARMVVEWLVANGRRRILFLDGLRGRGKRALPSWYIRRSTGYARACERAGVPLIRLDASTCNAPGLDFAERITRQAETLREHLGGSRAADAVVLLTDGSYFSAAEACRRLGREPGRDVLFAGYDNYWATHEHRRFESTAPSVTVDKRADIVCREIVRMVTARARGEAPDGPETAMIRPELVVTEWPSAGATAAHAKSGRSRRNRGKS